MAPALALAILAIPLYLAAAIINMVAFVRQRREHFGLSLITLLMAALSIGYATAYALAAAGAFPNLEPPINVVLLRPLVFATGILFNIIPGWLISAKQQHEDTENVKELLTKARFRQQQITTLEHERDNLKQLLEMCQAVNRALQIKANNE